MFSYEKLLKKLTPTLAEIGLNEQEIGLYCHSLAGGPATVSDLAKKLGLKSPNVYKLIVRLDAFGLSKFYENGKPKRVYFVESPSRALELLSEKRSLLAKQAEKLELDMPDLLLSYAQDAKSSKVQILNGEKQYRTGIEEMFKEVKNTLSFFGSVDGFQSSVSSSGFVDLTSKRVEKGLRLRALVLPSALAKDLRQRDELELRQTRFLKNPQRFETSFQLSRRKVIVWQPLAPTAILIEDVYIVQMLQNMFDGLWEHGSRQ